MSAAARTEPDAVPESGSPTLEIAGPRATIRLHRPRHHNRIQPEDIPVLLGLFDRVDADADLRVMVLTGSGHSFSSGYHLGDLAEPKQGQPKGPSFGDLTDRLDQVRVPTICRLNGGVYGGATDLALTCDFRIGHAGIEMFMPAARIGVHYYEGGLRRYISRLGLNTAKRLFLTAEKLDAAELLRIGYLTEVTTREGLDVAVDTLAARLAELAPLAVRGMKQALNEIAAGALDVPALRAREAVCDASRDLQEGLAAFREKRQPRFRGE